MTLSEVLAIVADSWVAVATPLQVAGLSHTVATMDNVTTNTEGAEYNFPSTADGILPGEGMPPFVALSFKQERATKLTRNGYKRLAGVAEVSQEDGAVNPALLGSPELQALENFLSNPVGSGDFQFLNVIAGRTSSGAIDFTRINSIDRCVVQPFLTTQNTRKRGRGS